MIRGRFHLRSRQVNRGFHRPTREGFEGGFGEEEEDDGHAEGWAEGHDSACVFVGVFVAEELDEEDDHAEDGAAEEGDDGIDPAQDSPHCCHEVNVAQAQGFFAEAEAAQDAEEPNNATAYEVAHEHACEDLECKRDGSVGAGFHREGVGVVDPRAGEFVGEGKPGEGEGEGEAHEEDFAEHFAAGVRVGDPVFGVIGVFAFLLEFGEPLFFPRGVVFETATHEFELEGEVGEDETGDAAESGAEPGPAVFAEGGETPGVAWGSLLEEAAGLG